MHGLTLHALTPALLVWAGWVCGAFSKPIGTRIGVAIRRRRLRAKVRVPIRVVIRADVADLLERVQAAAAWRPEPTIERRIRIVHPDWTPAQIAAEADYVRTHGGLA